MTRNRLLIALDVDGTIVRPDGLISERVRTAIRAVHARRHHVVLSTGRSPQATVPVITALGLTGTYAVCSNGAVTLRMEAPGEDRYTVVSESSFDPSAVLAALARNVPGCAVAVETPGGRGFRVTAAFAYELPGGVVTPWEQLGSSGARRVIVDGGDQARLPALLDELGMIGVADTTGLGDAMEVVQPGVSKAFALERLRTTLGVTDGDTVAVGDQANDLEMIRWAARGVAMGHAPAAVRTMAAEVTGSCADDGLADVLESIVKQECQGAGMAIVCVDDYRARARDLIAAHNWDYIEAGSGSELTIDANRKAFDAIRLRPRVLVDVSNPVPAIDLFGANLNAPIGVAPTAFHLMAHPEGEVATARGAGAAGAVYVVSTFASRTLEDIAAAATGPLWLQLYWLRDRQKVARLVRRAEQAGFRALMLTVDAPQLGLRRCDLRNGFVLDPGLVPINLGSDDSAVMHHGQVGESALGRHAAEALDASITWADLAWLRQISTLPILLKGILTAEDARLAVEHGMDGVVVSNHGGRQLDGAVPSVVALPEVVAAIDGRITVLVDGSIRNGRDVFVALALGAKAVLVGRPVLWSLAVGGSDGVAEMLTLLNRELTQTMALAGRPRVADIDRSVIA